MTPEWAFALADITTCIIVMVTAAAIKYFTHEGKK